MGKRKGEKREEGSCLIKCWLSVQTDVFLCGSRLCPPKPIWQHLTPLNTQTKTWPRDTNTHIHNKSCKVKAFEIFIDYQLFKTCKKQPSLWDSQRISHSNSQCSCTVKWQDSMFRPHNYMKLSPLMLDRQKGRRGRKTRKQNKKRWIGCRKKNM